MSKQTEALKLALEALEAEHSAVYGTSRTARAITAIREALSEQPAQQQEPVAWVGSLKDPQPHCVTDLKYCSAAQWDTGYHLKYIPLYTSPPASKPWVGLTQDELNMIGDKMRTWNSHSLVDVYTAIEAKLREKNA